MKTRDQILAKADTLSPVEEGSVEADMDEILREIAGKQHVMSAEEANDLLRSRDLYHFQGDAVRRIRKFLSE